MHRRAYKYIYPMYVSPRLYLLYRVKYNFWGWAKCLPCCPVLMHHSSFICLLLDAAQLERKNDHTVAKTQGLQAGYVDIKVISLHSPLLI